MFIVTEKYFDRLRRKAILLYRAKNLVSTRQDKKYVVTLPNDKKNHFGHPCYKDYLIPGDEERRFRYQQRASRINEKEGNFTYNDRNSPNVWSYHLLW